MEHLEAEVSQYAERPRSERPAVAYERLVTLVQNLIENAKGLEDSPASLIFLERAETWCDSLDEFHQGNAKLAREGTTLPKPNQLRLKVYTALRDAYAHDEHYEFCLRYATKGVEIERRQYADAQDRLAEETVAARNAQDDDTAQSTQMAATKSFVADLGVSIGRSMLNVCGLYSKLGRHNTACKTAAECSQFLDEQFRSELAADGGTRSTSTLSRASSDAENGAIDTADLNRRRRLDTLGVLRVAAKYNHGTELEHLGRRDEARNNFVAARRVGLHDHGLPANHPLMMRIEEALHSQPSSTPKISGDPLLAKKKRGTSMPRKLDPIKIAAPNLVKDDQQAGTRPLDSSQPAPPQTVLFAKSRRAPTTLPPGYAVPRRDVTTAPNTARTGRPAPSHEAPRSSHAASRPAPLGTLVNQSSASCQPTTTDSPIQPLGGSLDPISSVAIVDTTLLQIPQSTDSPKKVETARTSSMPRPPTVNASQTSMKSRTQGATPASTRRSQRSSAREKEGTSPTPQGTIMQQKQSMIQQRYVAWIAQFTEPLYDDYQRRDRAALRIQSAWRSSKARLDAFNRRQIFYHFVHQYQKGAARAILSRFRCFIEGRSRKNTLASQRSELQEKAERERVQRKAILTIQKNIRVYIERKRREEELMRQLKLQQQEKLRQYATAAVIVQRWWPMIKKEKQYWIRRNEEIAEQKRVLEALQRRHRAATSIQRLVRGHLGRGYVANFRIAEVERKRKLQRAIIESIDAIRIVLREYRHRKLRLERQREYEEIREVEAANRIRAGWINSLQRRKMHDVNHRACLVREAARAIQRCWRSFKSRRELRYMKKVRNATSQIRVEREWKQERATRRIQCAWRCHEAFRSVRRAKASIGRRKLLATWLIQRCGRGLAERRSAGTERMLRIKLYEDAVNAAIRRRHENASLIQAHCRLQLSVKEGTQRKEAIEAEELLIIRRMWRERTQDAAATKIQKIERGRLARMDFERRKELLHNSQQLVLRATIKLQCFFRVVAARRRMWSLKVHANKTKLKRQLQQEVQNEIFADRSNAFASLELLERQRLEEREAIEMEAICVAYLESFDDNDEDDNALASLLANDDPSAPASRPMSQALSPSANAAAAAAQAVISDDNDDEAEPEGPYDESPKRNVMTEQQRAAEENALLYADEDLLAMPESNGERAVGGVNQTPSESEDGLYD